MEWFIAFIVFAFCIVALVLVSKRWGKATTKAKIEKKKAEEMKDDAEISSRPYISKPFGRMKYK